MRNLIYIYIYVYIYIYIYILAWTRAFNARSEVGLGNTAASKLAWTHFLAACSNLETACCALVGFWVTFGDSSPALSLSLCRSLSLSLFISPCLSPSQRLSSDSPSLWLSVCQSPCVSTWRVCPGIGFRGVHSFDLGFKLRSDRLCSDP